MYKKLVIVFEGIEGSGKSYHILNFVSNYLKKKKLIILKYVNLVVVKILKKLEN